VTAATDTLRPVRNPNARRRRSPFARWYRRNERLILGVAGITTLLVLWEIGGRTGVVDQTFFSRPSAIAQAAVEQVQLPRFWGDVQQSALEFIVGYGVAVGTAVPLGILIGWYKRLSYMADPWINLLISIPRLALLPLVVLWLGLGVESKMAVVYLGTFFSVILPTIQGVRTVDRRFLDVAHSFGASERRLFASVVLPSTVPFITTGLRLGSGRALIGVVISEIYAQTSGLGVMIDRAADTLQPATAIFGVLIFTFTGVLMVQGLRRLEHRFDRWRPSLEEEA
jgi:NitT/TauT family transport system permease protein